jgi:hypothetical protein
MAFNCRPTHRFSLIDVQPLLLLLLLRQKQCSAAEQHGTQLK